jgi:hypothetical protein
MKLKPFVETIIVIAVILHLGSCIFGGYMPDAEQAPFGARGGE